MGRNFYSAKDFNWVEHDSGLVACAGSGGDPLFTVYNDGVRDMLVNAYMGGLKHGKQIGRAELQDELRRLLDAARS